MTSSKSALASLAIALALGGCAAGTDFDRYQDAILSFKTATDQASQAAAGHILTIRAWDRERMLTQLQDVGNPCDLPWVARRKEPGKPYAITDCAFLAANIVRRGRFSREAVAVRQQAFDVLNEYTDLLAAVAESDAPARWDSAAKGLGGSLNSLVATVTDAARAQQAGNFQDQLGRLRGLVGPNGPLTALISFAGQEWINSRRAAALDRIVTTGKPQIDEISRLLRADFDFVRKRDLFVVDSALSDTLFDYARAVEEAAADPRKVAARNGALAAMRRAIETNETQIAEVQSVGAAMDGFDDAHAALVAYAASSKEPGDLSRLVAAVKRYAAAARVAFDAYKVVSAPKTE